MADFVVYLKAEYVDAVYLQQDAFDPVDGSSSAERQRHVFAQVARVLAADLDFPDKDAARTFFQGLTQATKDWNRTALDDPAFGAIEGRLDAMLGEASGGRPAASWVQPAFNVTVRIANPSNGAVNTLTIHDVKIDKWTYDLPEDDFVMEQVGFQALFITVEEG